MACPEDCVDQCNHEAYLNRALPKNHWWRGLRKTVEDGAPC